MKFAHFCRQALRSHLGQLGMFVLCTMVGLTSIVALSAFDTSIQKSLEQDAKVLNGGDIIIGSSQPFSQKLEDEIAALEQMKALSTRVTSFPTIVYSEEQDTSLLSEIKAVDTTYPVYGNAQLQSGNIIQEQLQTGTVLVEPNVLQRMELERGDTLQIGEALFSISDSIISLPDASLDFFTAGHTILMLTEDLEKTELLGARSRVSYDMYIRLPEGIDVDQVEQNLQQITNDQEEIESFRSAETRTQRFFEELLFFLRLVSLFTLLIAGVGMMSILNNYLHNQQQTIAILKTVGMSNVQLMRLYLSFVLLLSSVGIVLGIVGGLGVLQMLPVIFADFLPLGFRAELQAEPVVQGMFLGIVMSLLFTALPLLQLRDIKPVQIFRKETVSSTARRFSFVLKGIFVILVGIFVVLQIGEIPLGIYFFAAIVGLSALIFLACWIALQIFSKMSLYIRQLSPHLAIKGLTRPGGNSHMIMAALATVLAILMSISLLEKNIVRQFVTTYPEDYPNVFLLDIQRDQQVELQTLLPEKIQFYPIIRGNLVRHNDNRITEETQEELGRTQDRVTRTFNLSYGVPLSENEEIVATQERGAILLSDWVDEERAQVSILKEFGDILGMELGDEIEFLIQGVPLTAEIVSIRNRRQDRIEPFFYFVFEESVLGGFPQTAFTTIHLDPAKIPGLQNTIAKQFPNITTINMTTVIAETTALLSKLSRIVQAFSLLGFVAGIILLISSLLATSSERIREAIYYKLLGFRHRQIASIAFIEFFFLGFITAVIGIVFAQLGVFWITHYVLSITFYGFPWVLFQIVCGVIVLILIIAVYFLLPLLRTRPIDYLRENTIQ